jgi:hypothetical protein
MSYLSFVVDVVEKTPSYLKFLERKKRERRRSQIPAIKLLKYFSDFFG